MSIRSQKTVIEKLQIKLQNYKEQLKTANRVLAKKKADLKIENKRLMKNVNDNVPQSKEELGKIARSPDGISVEIFNKIEEIKDLKKKIKAVLKELRKEQKRFAKLEKAEERRKQL